MLNSGIYHFILQTLNHSQISDISGIFQLISIARKIFGTTFPSGNIIAISDSIPLEYFYTYSEFFPKIYITTAFKFYIPMEDL